MEESIEQRRKSYWLSPSTRSFILEGRRTRDFSTFDLIHGYIYARWPYFYIGIGIGEHPLVHLLRPLFSLITWLFPPTPKPDGEQRTFADQYHGKVMPTAAARQLVQVNENIRLEDLEQVIPYESARDIILQNPDHIVALECPCRASRPNPCGPLDVCLLVGEPFASFVVEHHPDRARWISQDQATLLLEAERSRGHVHHAFFKDAMLGRFYAICNCCSCCCGAMQAMRNGTPMLSASGYTSSVDEDLCILCGECVEACPFGALENGQQSISVVYDVCMGCGICVETCELGAFTLVRDPQKGIPLEIDSLIKTKMP
jgi:Pyruvate/2-oxoacid:ferredoxin oxidoreductase delta subunit